MEGKKGPLCLLKGHFHTSNELCPTLLVLFSIQGTPFYSSRGRIRGDGPPNTATRVYGRLRAKVEKGPLRENGGLRVGVDHKWAPTGLPRGIILPGYTARKYLELLCKLGRLKEFR